MSDEIQERLFAATENLRKAKGYLSSLRATFSNSPRLLKVYEPSALELVSIYKRNLREILLEIDDSIWEMEKDADIWVSMEGNEFDEGKGPINIIGLYLQKLNSANRYVCQTIERKIKSDIKSDINPTVNWPTATFDLVATQPGSFKLGLKWPDYIKSSLIQEELGKEPWDIVKEAALIRNIVFTSINLLLKTIASVDNPSLLQELRNEYDDKEVIKIIHYAKDLTPSNRMPIDRIKFKVDSLYQYGTICSDKETRKLLTQRARTLKKDAIYVEGNGTIRALDLDFRTLVARPFVTGNESFGELQCNFRQDFPANDIPEYIDKVVQLIGLLFYDKNNVPIRLEIDNISIIEEDESETTDIN